MSDHTNPPAGGGPHDPNRPYDGRPPQSGPQNQYGGGGQPPQQGQPQNQPGQYGAGQGQPGQHGQGGPGQGQYGGGAPGQYGQQPGQYGQPGQGRPGQHGGQQPGQHGQGQPGQYSQPGQGQPGQYGGGQQPGQYGQQPGQYGQPGQGQPGQYGQGQPGQYGQGQPGPGQYGQHGNPAYGPGGTEETMQFGGPGGPGGPHAQQWEPEKKRKRGKLIPLIAAVAVLLVLGGGGAFAYSRIAGGDQPSSVLPASSVGYVRVDLKPSAGQQVAALRFMRKFPTVRDELSLTGDNDDLRQKLFEFVKKNSGDDLADVDFAKDIEPWIGNRVGIAAVPRDGKPNPVVAVQITDEGKAKAGLDKLFADEEEKPGKAFLGDYVLIAEDQAAADAAANEAKNNPLDKNEKFDKDMSALGEQGFASAWADTQGLATLAGDELTEDQRKALPAGSMAAALRFDDAHVELKGVVHGDKSLKAESAKAEEIVTALPDSTAGAFALSDGENLIGKVWEQLEKSSSGGVDLGKIIRDAGEKYGIALPDDLKTVLGKNFAVAVDRETGDNGPNVAAVMKTDPAKAEQVIDKVLAAARKRGELPIEIQKAKNNDTLVIATSKAYAEKTLQGGKLGDTEAFKAAIPDAKGSVSIGYVDFDGVKKIAGRELDNPDFNVLRSAGYTSRITGDGEAEFTVRVVAK